MELSTAHASSRYLAWPCCLYVDKALYGADVYARVGGITWRQLSYIVAKRCLRDLEL